MDKKFAVVTIIMVAASVIVIGCINLLVNSIYPVSRVPGEITSRSGVSENPTAQQAAQTPPAEKPATASAPPPAETPASTPAAPVAAPDQKPLPERLAAANVEAGQQEARKCAVCHTFEKGGANKVGPNLYGIVNRAIGKQEGFAYSEAMKNHGGTWDYKLLDCYIKDPKSCIPSNKMAFAGVKDDAARANVIAFLRTLGDSPAPLPAP